MKLTQNAFRLILNNQITYPEIELLESFLRLSNLIGSELQNDVEDFKPLQICLNDYELYKWAFNQVLKQYKK